MPYRVKEIFYTLQGEGAHTGRAAVFCRFSGCNLWSGQERHRAKALCPFCDTDFVGTNGIHGGRYRTATALAEVIQQCWPTDFRPGFVVCTGGEPLLQLDSALIQALHERQFQIAVETNGTIPAPAGIDWLCVSPKANTPLRLTQGNELKLVYPQAALNPADYQLLAFTYFFLQPRDDEQRAQNLQKAILYCQQHPQWRLSVQTHKWLGIP